MKGRLRQWDEFQVRGEGTYVVPKVIDRGYLALGEATFDFVRRER